MNYELAKQLRDAGFPQDHINHPVYEMDERGRVLIPTLEELIEACGESFRKLEFTLLPSPQWHSYGPYNEPIMQAHAATPTEAVAKLWLALNKTAQPLPNIG